MLLTTAFYLSILTYYLGVLIYMLPIPFYGLKKWAPTLMIDGVFSAILVFSYNTILWLIDYIGEVIGSDWEYYNNWLTNEVASLVSLMITLKAIGISLSSIGLQFLANGLISPLISSLTYVLLFILVYSSLVAIIDYLAPTLIALGILLHSIPFRLTRSSGATIISIVIVFTVASPLMPNFVDMFTTNMVGPGYYKYGVARALFYVLDAKNDSVSYMVLEIRDDKGELLARYIADRNGLINASSLDTGIPSKTFIANFTIAGYYYRGPIDPNNYTSIGNRIYNITITIPNLLQLKPLRLVAVYNTEINPMASGNGYVIFETHSGEPEIIVIALQSDDIYILVDSYQPQPSDTIYYTWGGIGFKAYIYELNGENHDIEVIVEGNDNPAPSIKTIRYIADTLRLGLNNPSGYIEPVVYYMYRLFIAPLVYVSILLSTSIALAKLLGGSSSKIAKIVVTGI